MSAGFGQPRGRSNSIVACSPGRPSRRQAAKGPANISRYAEEFEEIRELGNGEFGTVRCTRFVSHLCNTFAFYHAVVTVVFRFVLGSRCAV